MAIDVALVVNGRRYGGWKSLRVTRSIESLAGSFDLEVSDRWAGQDEPWPIRVEDECEVQIGGETVITGFIGVHSGSGSTQGRSLRYTGKDRAAALVECSLMVLGATIKAQVTAGGEGDLDPTKHSGAAVKWVYSNIAIDDFCRAIATPHGISVSVQSGLAIQPVTRIIVSPGEKCFDAIKRVAEGAEVLVVSDGRGGIRITRAGTAAASILQEGFNILDYSYEFNAEDRYRTYLISTQVPGTDQASGAATQVQASATDVDVRRAARTLLIRPDKGYTTADARKRADWEARIRAANGTKASVTVRGWLQPNGTLWPINAFVTLKAPRTMGIDGQMLISQVEYTLDPSGQRTKLSIVRPDAFAPEPQAKVSGEGAWLVGTKGGGFAEPAGTGGR